MTDWAVINWWVG